MAHPNFDDKRTREVTVKATEGISKDTKITLTTQEDYFVENPFTEEAKIVKYNKNTDTRPLYKLIEDLTKRVTVLEQGGIHGSP